MALGAWRRGPGSSRVAHGACGLQRCALPIGHGTWLAARWPRGVESRHRISFLAQVSERAPAFAAHGGGEGLYARFRTKNYGLKPNWYLTQSLDL